MQSIFYPANERGEKNIGWLNSRFSFSFSNYRNPARKNFGLLHTFNDDVVQPKGGFGLHPHMNMEIISVLLKGTMNHKDSLGYAEIVQADAVQIMSAGSGIRHEEHNVGNDEVHFLQIWIEPKIANIQPRYQRRNFPKQERTNELTTIVSNEEGVKHCWINQNARICLGYFTEKTNQSYHFKNKENSCAFIFTISGSLIIANHQLNERDGAGFWDTEKLNLSIEPNTEFIVIEVPINH